MGHQVDHHVVLDSVCAKSDDIVSRKIEDEILIVPLVGGIGDTDGELYTLNITGQAIWLRLDGNTTLRDIVSALADEYGAAAGELEADVLGFTGELARRGFLVVKA